MYPEGSENVSVNELIGVISLEEDSDDDIKNFIKNYKSISSSDASDAEGIDTIKANNNSTEDTIKPSQNIMEEHNTTDIDNNISKNNRKLISPLARRIADLENIDISNINGSGPKGRIVKKDLENKINNVEKINSKEKFSLNNEVTILKLSNIRKTIASRLQEAKSTVPHFYLKGKVVVNSLFNERKNINSFYQDENINLKISFNDFFIKAIALSLKNVPEMNAIWNGDGTISKFNEVDISIAVATEEGLFTPIIKSACKKSLSVISMEMKALASKAKEGKLLPEDYNGGSFSLSNLGMYDINEFSAIINPPQSGIIALGSIIEDVIVENKEIKLCKTVSYTLSVDHRIVDGVQQLSS